jgi:hypothetical protein
MAEYQGKKVELNKPRKIPGVTPAGKKKTVFVRDPKSKKLKAEVVEAKIVHFGAEGYSDYTKHKNKKRRANFRSRHNCAEKKDKTKPAWWACNYLW